MVSDLTLTITGDSKSLHEFIRMIAWMDLCSKIGHSTKFDISYFVNDSINGLDFKVLETSEDYQKIVNYFRDDLFMDHIEPYEFRM